MIRRRDLPKYQPSPYDSENYLTVREGLIYKKLDSITGEVVSNAATSTSTIIFGTTSLRFDNGHLELVLTEDLPIIWKLQCWVKIDSGKTFPILSLDTSLLFSIVLDEALNTVTLLYSPIPGDVVTVSKLMLVTTDWTFITLIRKADKLEVYSNLVKVAEFTEVYYPSATGNLYFGKDLVSTNHFYGNAQSLLLDLNFDTDAPFLANLDIFKKYYMPTTSAVNRYSTILTSDSTYSEGIGIYPGKGLFTYFDSLDNSYVIYPSEKGLDYRNNTRGLVIVLEEEDNFHPNEFILDIEFELLEINSSFSTCVIFATSMSYGFYISYDAISGQLKFHYYISGDSVEKIDIIGPYVQGTVKLSLERLDSYCKVHYNGVEVLNIASFVRYPLETSYSFNYNLTGFSNTGTLVKLRRFTVSDLIGAYEVSDDSYVVGSSIFYKSYASEAYRLHQIGDRITAKRAFIPFTLSTTTIEPGQSKTLTITQIIEYSAPVLYTVTIKIPEFSDLTTDRVTYTSNAAIASGTLTATLDIALATFTQLLKVSYFDVEVTNGTFSTWTRVPISNVTVIPNSAFQISGYADGILADDDLNGFTTVDGTTTISKSTNSLYGDTYRITNSSQRINLSPKLTGIRTMFLAYQEFTSVSNRIYFGDSSNYTFNGGPGGQLLGELIVSGNDFLIVRNSTMLVAKVVINATDSVIIRANEASDTIEVVRKVNTSWGEYVDVQTLNLQLQTPSSIDNCSIDITPDGSTIVLGFPNANNGEGVVQVWDYTATWTKSLHIGSPNPIPNNLGGFGSFVSISPDGSIIAMSEMGTKSVFLYKKATTWPNAPFQTITSTVIPLGVSITDTYLGISYNDDSIRLYEQDIPSWTLDSTLSGYNNCVLDKLSNKFLMGNVFTGVVKLRDISAPTVDVQSFSGPALSYGFSLAILDSVVAISNPTDGEIEQYSPSSYTTPVVVSNSAVDYGIYFSMSTTSIVATNYDNIFTIHTSDSAEYGERIANTYVDGTLKPHNTVLSTGNVSIYAFTTVIPMSINQIGSGYNSTYGANALNGLFLGALFYNRVLTDTEIATISNILKRRLDIKELKLSE